jgi:hypothetical protein
MILMSETNSTRKPTHVIRRMFEIIGGFLLFLIFFVCFVGPFVAIGFFWDDIFGAEFPYDFFGILLPIPTIAWIVIAIIFPIGLYGMITVGRAVKSKIKKGNFRLSWKPKVAAISIIVLAVVAFLYYVPFWYLYLGIKPQFGPYIAYNGEDGMLISWDSSALTQSQVIYGTDPDLLTSQAFGGEYYWETGDSTYHHAVKLDPLVRGQKYYYKIPSFDNALHSFTMAPDAGSDVSFAILGDTQGAFNTQQTNMKWISALQRSGQLNFTVITGDLVNDDDNINEWAMLMHSNSWGKISSSIPWHATSGNHETGCTVNGCEPRGNFKKFFQNNYSGNWDETDQWDVGTYYSFNYSNVHFVILDPFENQTNLLTQTQLDWLDQDLSNNINNWKFLSFHLSMYSTSDHGSYPSLAAQLEPILWKHQVDAIFYGHDHVFESYHINATEPYGGTYAFMVSGGGGSLKDVLDMGSRSWNGTTNAYGNLINIVAGDTEHRFEGMYGYQWQTYAERTHHYMRVSVSDQTATFAAYRTWDNSLIKSYSMVR